MLHLALTLTTLLQLIHFASAANACKKDACYSVVIGQGQRGGPNVASRRADCMSILRTVMDDDQATVRSTITNTLISGTTVTTTATVTSISTSYQQPARRRAVSANHVEGSLELEARDRIVIKGSKPDYAMACRSDQDSAIACLCAGIKGSVQQSITQTILTTTTLTKLIPQKTDSTTTTTSTTLIAPRPTACSRGQEAYCNNCYCFIKKNSNEGGCYRAFNCDPGCSTDADYDDFFGVALNLECVNDGVGLCGQGKTYGVCVASGGDCPAPQPFKRALGELEGVFVEYEDDERAA